MKKLGSNNKVKVAAGFGGEKKTDSGSTPGQGSFMNIPVESLNPNPYQPRKVFDQEELESLAQSIRHTGVLLPVCIFIEDGRYFIGDGERRWRASKLAGKRTVPCFVTTGNPAEVALIGNMQRADLKPIEEAEAYALMQKEFGYTHKELAQLIGRSRNNITETLSLIKLPDSIKEKCLRVDIPKRKLIAIARKKSPEEMETAVSQVTGTPSPGQTVEKSSRVARVCAQVEKMTEKIKKLGLEDCSREDAGAFINALRNLKTEIEQYPSLAPPKYPAVPIEAIQELAVGLNLSGSCSIKLLNAGFRIFRTEEREKKIKELTNSGGWKLVDKFKTKKAMNDAMKELLADPMCVKD
ncbi:MAG: ParB/RepB/Spo0J family partition protein [Desulfobacterium sp.]|nr:ParB/RepB/Spo0J family partition protein [Desulfobacterium sp.]